MTHMGCKPWLPGHSGTLNRGVIRPNRSAGYKSN